MVLSDPNRMRYLAARARAELTSRVTALRARGMPQGAVAVVGAYHCRNLGDMTLARAVSRALRGAGRSHSLRDVHRLHRYPAAQATIFGGGATAVPALLEAYCARCDAVPARTVLAGMDFRADADRFPARVLDLLASAAAVSVRSRRQQERLGQQLARDDVAFQWDLAFASGLQVDEPAGREARAPVLGLNVLPFFMEYRGGQFQPGHALEQWYRSTGSEIAGHVRTLGPAYVDFVREVVRAHASRGYRVVHIPFALEDGWFARTFLAGTGVEFRPFSLRPDRVLAELRTCSVFLATRYHAHVYALMAGVPLLSFQYAEKVRDLWDDLGLAAGAAVARLELVKAGQAAREKVLGGSPVVLPPARRVALRAEAEASLAAALSALPEEGAALRAA